MTYSPPSANAPSLRDAVADDSPAIVALVRALAAHIGDVSLAKVTPEGLAAALAAPDPLCRAVVAESAKGDIVGVCLYSVIFSTWVGAPGLFVIDLYVKNEARKSQLGRLLLTAAAREGRVRGCRFIRLDVDARNRLAEGFYLRLGFQKLDGDSSFLLKAEAFDALAGA